jgi:hypothetical protein
MRMRMREAQRGSAHADMRMRMRMREAHRGADARARVCT